MNEQIIIEQMQSQAPAMPMGLMIAQIVIGLAVYIFFAWCMAKIGVKMGMPFGSTMVWALIPIANIFLMLKLAAKPMWWFILLIIPIVNLVIAILMWISIAERLGKPSWWGVVIALVPIVNIVMLMMLVFEKGGVPAPKAA